MTERTSTFTLHVEPGNFHGGEIIGLLGENGCGKTTFMELLAGSSEQQKKKKSKKLDAAGDAPTDISDPHSVAPTA